jgi:hypothetical protein
MCNTFSLEAARDSMPSQEKIGYVNSLHVFNKNENSNFIVQDAE